MDKDTVKKIKSVVGSEYVLESPEERICYSYDGTARRGIPALVVLPGNAREVAEIVRLANEKGFPIFPRGAGTGLSGGSVPAEQGLAMVLSRMNRILEISRDDLLAVVEPGVVTGRLHRAVEKEGLFYPPDPSSLQTCTIGGNVAENAGGPRAFKYGVTRDYVLGLEVVTPTGEIINTGGRTVKNVTGYDLTGLLTGSEGTLGIITRITLRLVPKPRAVQTALAVYNRVEDAASTVTAMIRRGIIPATLELMDRITIRCVENYLRLGLPMDAGAILLIEVDGLPAQVAEEMKLVEDACRQNSCRALQTATDAAERERLWKARRAVSTAIVQIKPTKISEDATVPRSKIPEMVERLKSIGEKYGLHLPVFGHAGDGNLHPNILVDKRDPVEMEKAEKAVQEIFRAALDLGGTLSGEHGVGLLKKPYLEWEAGAGGIEYMKAIKKAVDPRNVLNPGKIFQV
ncbi:FAD-binding oxidoreductase [Desulfoscipio geothermicus]|uniref:Glycolate oxidase n=1 Tax=Desulfoscipio geothermicus DSM 3669 TaxID=1121426 RepID=A0A1I6DSX8_9FIRM|nr:FAD-linked oxidase C-terminal domain-containing protein [Desulfoscipio geothermicus]SFR08559.1 glycolate oxidase [Desulfoscipio geothermicus DSM 3669]